MLLLSSEVRSALSALSEQTEDIGAVDAMIRDPQKWNGIHEYYPWGYQQQRQYDDEYRTVSGIELVTFTI